MAVFSSIAAAISGIVSAVGAGIGAVGGAIGAGVAAVGGAGAAIAGAAGLAGLGLAGYGMYQQAKGARLQAQASQRAETLRLKQMNLQAARERRSSLRQAIVARAQALSAATSQGAGQGSGLQGGYGQIGGQLGNNMQGTSQGQQIGQGMFEANSMATRGQQYQSIGAGFSNFGNFLMGNYGTLRSAFGG